MDYSEIELRGDNDPLADAIDGAKELFDDLGEHITSIFKAVTGITSLDDLFGKVERGIRIFEDWQEDADRLNMHLKNAGSSGMYTFDVMMKIAEGMSQWTKYTDKQVMAAEQLLLTYSNIKGNQGVFQGTLESAADLAQYMGVELPTAARILGKALQDPRKANEELEESGIELTKQQRAQIEMWLRMGNVTNAQLVILDAIQDKLGGAAATAADTFTVRMDKLGEASDKVWRSIGEFVVPFVNKAIDVMNAASTVVTKLGKDFLASFGPGDGMEGIADKTFKVLTEWFWKFVDTGIIAFSYVQAAIEDWDSFSEEAFDNFKLLGMQAFLAVLDFAAQWAPMVIEFMSPVINYAKDLWDKMVAVAEQAWQDMYEGAMQFVDRVVSAYETVKAVALQAWDWMVEVAVAAWEAIGVPVVDWSLKAIGAIYFVYLVAKNTWDLMSTVAETTWELISSYTSFWFEVLKAEIGLAYEIWSTYWTTLFSLTGFGIDTVIDLYRSLYASILGEGGATFGTLGEIVGTFFDAIKFYFAPIISLFTLLFDGLRELGVAVVTDFSDAVARKIGKAGDEIKGFKDKIAGLMKKADEDNADAEQKRWEEGPENPANVFAKPDFAGGLRDALRDGMADFAADLKDNTEELKNKANQDKGIGPGFQKLIDQNRKTVDVFVAGIDSMLEEDKKKARKSFWTDIAPFMKDINEKDEREGRGGGSGSSSEDALAMYQRIAGSAAQQPTVEELRKLRKVMEDNLAAQQAIRDHLRMVHTRGQRTPKFGMKALVNPLGAPGP